MIRFWRYRGSNWPSAQPQPGDTVLAFKLEVPRSPGTVNARTCKLWRSDQRYPGQVTVYRDEESGGVVLEFDALRHGGREPRAREIVAPEHVDKLILSLLEVRSGPWEEAA